MCHRLKEIEDKWDPGTEKRRSDLKKKKKQAV
jgi:hypothetical protein